MFSSVFLTQKEKKEGMHQENLQVEHIWTVLYRKNAHQEEWDYLKDMNRKKIKYISTKCSAK